MHYYLVHIQFLGYRYHGWIKQPNVKTIQGTIEKALGYVLKHTDFKTLGCSRTDAGVSANHMAFELFIHSLVEKEGFVQMMNENLPADIRIIEVEDVDSTFNVIKSPHVKEYIYLFSFGGKQHPFAASLMANFPDNLDVGLMNEGAKLFEGKHDFSFYTRSKNVEGKDTTREIVQFKISGNDIFTANFFPEKSYVLHIHSKGFLRYQIRLMMSHLVELGRGTVKMEDIRAALSGKGKLIGLKPAPPAGLILNKIVYDKT